MTMSALNHAMISLRRVWGELDRANQAIFRF